MGTLMMSSKPLKGCYGQYTVLFSCLYTSGPGIRLTWFSCTETVLCSTASTLTQPCFYGKCFSYFIFHILYIYYTYTYKYSAVIISRIDWSNIKMWPPAYYCAVTITALTHWGWTILDPLRWAICICTKMWVIDPLHFVSYEVGRFVQNIPQALNWTEACLILSLNLNLVVVLLNCFSFVLSWNFVSINDGTRSATVLGRLYHTHGCSGSIVFAFSWLRHTRMHRAPPQPYSSDCEGIHQTNLLAITSFLITVHDYCYSQKTKPLFAIIYFLLLLSSVRGYSDQLLSFGGFSHVV